MLIFVINSTIVRAKNLFQLTGMKKQKMRKAKLIKSSVIFI